MLHIQRNQIHEHLNVTGSIRKKNVGDEGEGGREKQKWWWEDDKREKSSPME